MKQETIVFSLINGPLISERVSHKQNKHQIIAYIGWLVGWQPFSITSTDDIDI